MKFFLASAFVLALVALPSINAATLPARQIRVGKKSGSISKQCETSFLTLLTSPLATCLNFNELFPMFLKPPTTPITPILVDYAHSLCSTPVCTEEEISSSVGPMVKACSAELKEMHWSEEQVIKMALQILPTYKKIMCLTDPEAKQKSTFCFTTFLNKVEESLLAPKNLTLDTAEEVLPVLFGGDVEDSPGLEDVYALECSECAAKAEAIIRAGVTKGPEELMVQRKVKKLSSHCAKRTHGRRHK